MLRLQRQELLHALLPGGHVLAGQAVNEIQRQVLYLGLPGGGHRLAGLLKGVGPVDGPQLLVAGGLGPQGEPVHPRPAEPPEHLYVHAVRVGLHGHLSLPAHVKPLLYRPHQFGDPFFPVKAGGAAAEIDGVHLIPLGKGCRLLDMGQQGLLIVVHPVLPPRQGVEVAVVALAAAEGDVDVNTQLFRHRGAPRSLVSKIDIIPSCPPSLKAGNVNFPDSGIFSVSP